MPLFVVLVLVVFVFLSLMVDDDDNDEEEEEDFDSKKEVDGVVVVDANRFDETTVLWDRINGMKRKQRYDVSSL